MHGRDRGDYIRQDDKYASIFGEDKYDLGVYLKCISLFRKVSQFCRALA